jgi:hypothetical protein
MTIQTRRTLLGKLLPSQPWQLRLTPVNDLPVYHGCGGDHTMTLFRVSPDTDYEYEIEVQVTGVYEPEERGGRDSPSWDAYWSGVNAYYYREGKGWIELGLTSSEQEQIEEFLGDTLGGGRSDDYDGPDDRYYDDRSMPDLYDGTGRY